MTKIKHSVHDCTPGYRLLGDFWVLRIISTLSDGQKRFSEIERTLGDINTATLSKRLAKLHEDGVIGRNEQQLSQESDKIWA